MESQRHCNGKPTAFQWKGDGLAMESQRLGGGMSNRHLFCLTALSSFIYNMTTSNKATDCNIKKKGTNGKIGLLT